MFQIIALCRKGQKEHAAEEGTPVEGRCGNCSYEAAGCLVFHSGVAIHTIVRTETKPITESLRLEKTSKIIKSNQNQVAAEELCTRMRGLAAGHARHLLMTA